MLAAARRAFVEHGYRGATMRGIAAEAGVDAALLNYRFGSKRGLFIAAMGAALDPASRVAAALDGPAAGTPRRLVDAAVSVLADDEARAAMREVVGAALGDPQLRLALAEYVDREIVARIERRLGGPAARERAAAAVTVLSGVVFANHLVGVPTVTEADRDAYAQRIEAALVAAARPRISA